MSRNTYKKYDCSDKYHKEHLLAEISETYMVYCLEHGYSPLPFTKEPGKDEYHTDYGICCEVHEAAKRVCEMGGGKIMFATTTDRPMKGEVRHNV